MQQTLAHFFKSLFKFATHIFKAVWGGGVKGHLNNVKKTALLVREGFPYRLYTLYVDRFEWGIVGEWLVSGKQTKHPGKGLMMLGIKLLVWKKSWPPPFKASKGLVHCCTLSLWYLGAETDDQHRNPNMNNKDHLVGQLTTADRTGLLAGRAAKWFFKIFPTKSVSTWQRWPSNDDLLLRFILLKHIHRAYSSHLLSFLCSNWVWKVEPMKCP